MNQKRPSIGPSPRFGERADEVGAITDRAATTDAGVTGTSHRFGERPGERLKRPSIGTSPRFGERADEVGAITDRVATTDAQAQVPLPASGRGRERG